MVSGAIKQKPILTNKLHTFYMKDDVRPLKIALYPGDGIGREVTEATIEVLEALMESTSRLELDFTWHDWGYAYYEKEGRVVPEGYLDTLKSFDAIFLGAVGWPDKLPDNITLEPLIQIRQTFDLYACVRPACTFPGVESPLKIKEPLDLVVIRENSEGEYVDAGGYLHRGSVDEVAVQSALHSRRGIKRILEFAFNLSMDRRRKVTLITKSNAQRYAYVLWEEVFFSMAREQFPDVTVNRCHIDAATLYMVNNPGQFDVIVGSNLFGDILSDLSGAITGSLGLNPSANLNPDRSVPSLFEPVHGSAPDIAGKGIANPTGAILSGAQMLHFLGFESEATRIREAVNGTFAAGNGTRDVGGTLSTREFTQHIASRLNNG